MRSCPEETQTKLIHSGCTIIFVVIEDELLCTAYRSTGKTWHTGIQSVKIVGVVEVIIKRPVAGHLVNEVYSLSILVIPNPVPLVGVCEISISIANRDVGQNLGRG